MSYNSTNTVYNVNDNLQNYSDNDDAFLLLQANDSTSTNDFINTILNQRNLNIKDAEKRKLAEYFKHVDMNDDEKTKLIECVATNEDMEVPVFAVLDRLENGDDNKDAKNILGMFLNVMVEHPEMSDQFKDLLKDVEEIKENPAILKDEKFMTKVKDLIQQIGSKIFNIDDIAGLLQSTSPAFNAIEKYQNAKDDTERKDALDEVHNAFLLNKDDQKSDQKGIKKLVSGDKEVVQKNKSLVGTDGSLLGDQSPKSNSYGDLESLLKSFGNGPISLGQIFMILLLFVYLTRDLDAKSKITMVRNQEVTKSAKDYQQFIKNLASDMAKDDDNLKCDGDLYTFLNKLHAQTDPKYKDLQNKYFGDTGPLKEFNIDIKFVDPKDKDGEKKAAEDFAVSLQKSVSDLNNKVQSLGSNAAIVGFPYGTGKDADGKTGEDNTHRIVFECTTKPDPTDSTKKVFDKIKQDWFTDESKGIDNVTDAINTINTVDKAKADNAGQTAEAASSAVDRFTNVYAQTLKGQ